MAVTGKNISDWSSPDEDVTYIVLNPGPAKNITTMAKTWTLQFGDLFIVSPEGNVVLKYRDGRADRNGRIMYYASNIPLKFIFSDGQATTGGVELKSPTIKNDMVSGATQVQFMVGSPSGSDIVNDDLTLARLM